MLEPVKKNIDGVDFEFLGIPSMRVAKLDKRVATLVLPIVGGLNIFDLKADVDMSKLVAGLQNALLSLDDSTFTALIKDTLAYVTWIGEKGAQPLSSEAMMDACFAGRLDLMYQVIFEAWRFNKLSVFIVADRFGSLAAMLTSAKDPQNVANSGLKLETSAN